MILKRAGVSIIADIAGNRRSGASDLRITAIGGAGIAVITGHGNATQTGSIFASIRDGTGTAIVTGVVVVFEDAVSRVQGAVLIGTGVVVVAGLCDAADAQPVLADIPDGAEVVVLAGPFHILVGAATFRVAAIIGAGVVVVAG